MEIFVLHKNTLYVGMIHGMPAEKGQWKWDGGNMFFLF